MSRYSEPKRLVRYLLLALLITLLLWYLGWEDNGWLKAKLRYLIRALT